MSILSKLFGGHQSNPMNDANQYFNQIPGQAHNTYDPYVEQGKTADTQLTGQYNDLMNDPTGFINKLMEHFKTSEGYGFQKDALTKELGNTAAMGGIAGTPQDQMNQGTAVQGLLSKDMQQFLENALGVYGKGLSGTEGVSNRGYDASGKLNDMLGSNLNQQGTLAFNNAQNKNQQHNDFINTLTKAFVTLGRGAMGGPLGAGIGNSIFGNKK